MRTRSTWRRSTSSTDCRTRSDVGITCFSSAPHLPGTSPGRVVTWGTPPRKEGCRTASQGLQLSLMTEEEARSFPRPVSTTSTRRLGGAPAQHPCAAHADQPPRRVRHVPGG
ncbi:hypothetical protein Krad_2174 [Kineococcus radiotolerans SRS30216 = ATCC BAA-149]|uniref:Uncharacterized protein n=1 Tax=Kineococcus radiotolerans (strain ATCC BAA-149 / DSM 14245 / SRS30216) TaxID=266940 RepID=A6WA18_KINRD|nr:hypothetical protein Krad_2174 [Kineococcus radiotolerans SRS30216 = ATCC BAA-149]